MARKSKVEQTIKKPQAHTITEEEQQKDPIFRSIYKKIRNTKKKLTTIEQLESQDPETLETEQVTKLERKDEYLR